ncbi:MAG: C25 family cysteine peptidase [Acidobacteriota bacterium]
MKTTGNPRYKSSKHFSHQSSFRALAFLFAVMVITAAIFYLQNQRFTAKAAPAIVTTVISADGVWQQTSKTDAMQRLAPPIALNAFTRVSLNREALATQISQAPMEFTDAAQKTNVILTLPMPDGTFAKFRIEESPIMAAALAAKFPQVKTYKAQGIDDPTATARFDFTPLGFHAIILSANGTSFIEPLAKDDPTNYLAYYNRDLSTDKISLGCLVGDAEMADAERRGVLTAPNVFSTGTSLRTYRLAVAATGEFTTQYGGGDPNTALTQITSLINQVNAIYQREATITFQLIANELSIIYTNGSTDPYTNSSPSTMLNENQTNLTNVIGSANYDIGHVFGDITVSPGFLSFSGIAQLGVVCGGSKGRGASTMGGTPITHSIFVSGVTHEFAHQFSAPHTFNTTSGGCSGQRSGASSYEPGSGSTIMGYTICSPDNLQTSNELYFHTGSLEFIIGYANGSGNCATTAATGNSAPTIAALSNYSIPASTPFSLTASPTDPNGDAMTYVWEEFDLGAAAPPHTDDGTRPLFRSFTPSTNTSRTFPRLQYILNNANVPPSTYTCGSGSCLTGELLPSTTRTMNFRFTARDNRAAGGGTANASMSVSVVSTAGPFAVTQPNTSTGSWTAGSSQLVTWNVANTTAAPINAANVKISLSTDGGNTFPTVLAASTPNDGSEFVTVPNLSSPSARVKVEAVGNIFFDMSDANFSLNVANSTLCNSTSISIPLTGTPGAATPYSSNIAVSGLNTGTVKVSVTLTNFSHTWPRDVDVMLEAPTGQKVMLMSDVGGTNPGVSNLTLTIDEDAASNFPSSGSGFVTGSYRPTNLNDGEGGDTFPSPAPAAPYSNTLADLKGLNPNGTWRLWVVDDVGGDGGSISGGWCLNISTPASPTAVNLVSFNATAYNDGQVLTEWKTGYEADNLGFNVYRDEGGKLTRINQQLIGGSALLAGGKTVLAAGEGYAWSDALTSFAQPVQYRLEAIDLNGKATMYGPFELKYALGKAPSLQRSEMLAKLGARQATLVDSSSSTAMTRKANALEPSLAQTALPTQQAAKLLIKREGYYRVTQSELIAAGIPRDVDPRRLQMLVDGREIPINVKGENDGRFDTTDAVEFYGLGLDSTATDERVYWLTFGNQAGLRVKSAKVDGATSGAASFTQTGERKDRFIYFSALRNGDRENFFGSLVTSNWVNQEMTLRNLAATATPAVVEVVLQGVTQSAHRVSVQLNGGRLGDVVFTGQENKTASFTISPALLKEGINLVQLKAEQGASDVSLVDAIRIKYQRAFTAANNTLRFSATARQRVTVGGFTSRNLRVFDVTNADAAQELAVDISGQKTGFAINVVAGGSGQRQLLAISDEQAQKPFAIKANRASNLRSATNIADFVIITPREFYEAMLPLKALRETQGFKVTLVDLEDVFDEFNNGHKSPQAIKDFLNFAQTHWQIAPRFVMLVGDASYDPKNYLGTMSLDHVPTRLIETANMETASDDWFADFNNDGVTEMLVGRLPAQNLVALTAVLTKLIAYEQSQVSQEALLVSDANDGFNFEAASGALREALPENLEISELKRGQMDAATARKQLLEAMMRGQKLINYAGHGSLAVWRGNLLTATDALSLTNRDRLPLMVTMTCLNGYFQDPMVESLGEAFLKAPNGGAIAVWASSGMSLPGNQAAMNRELYRALFQANGKPVTLGEAIQKAKRVCEDLDTRKTWILFGDPTLQLR